MKRTMPFLLLVIFAAVTVAIADDAWKEKPYQQWDMKDVQKVLNDSPWVRVIHVKASWRKIGKDGVPVDADGSSPGSYGSQGRTGGGGDVGSSSSYGIPGGGAPTNANSGSIAQNGAILNAAKTPEATFAVRGAMSEADAGKALGDEPVEYAIAVAGPDMTPFAKAEEKDLASKAFLQPKKENKISAARVTIQRVSGAKPEDPRSVAAVVFYFAQKTETGEPTLSQNVKSVEFACDCGGAALKASFDLSKMASGKGPDW